MSRTPELSDPRTYVSNQGIVELRYGVEKRTVEWQQDLYDYVRESLAEGKTFDPEFCRKDKKTGKRYWFACIVCPCNSYNNNDLVSHVKGHKHQKHVIEKLNSQSNLSRNTKRERSSDHQESRPSNSRSNRSRLQNRIMYGPDYPFLGLEYITEYVDPGNPNKDPMYTCSLEGCKSAWGSASIMYNHLTSNKNKHNRSYLTKYYEIPNLTVDQIFNKSRQVFEEKKTENNNRVDVNIKQVSNRKQYSKVTMQYSELHKNRSSNWSEKTARREKEKPQSDLTHYWKPREPIRRDLIKRELFKRDPIKRDPIKGGPIKRDLSNLTKDIWQEDYKNNNIVKIEENLEDSKTNIKYELGEKPGTFEEYHRTTFAPNIKSETFLIQDEIKID